MSGAQELALGELVAEKFGSDFFFLDRFPTEIRPFYTMPCPDDNRCTISTWIRYTLNIRLALELRVESARQAATVLHDA